MTEQRKLAAVMFTDIIGYTAMMAKDEQKTMALLRKNRGLQESLAKRHNGEFLKEMGDGTLLCFQSALDAVRCAMEIQQSLKDDAELNLRIGIHLGDIVFKDGDVFGDGVNVASRVEKLADSGGIFISGQVYKIVRDKPGINTVFLGERQLKNVGQPVNIYALSSEGLAKPSVRTFSVKQFKAASEKKLRKLLPLVGIVISVFICFYIIQKVSRKPSGPRITGKNSIAVMYFENLTGDSELDWIEAGMVEMLTANLGRFPDLTVLSSQRLFDIMRQVSGDDATRINKSVATQIAEKAGIRTMLLGSVIGSTDQIRLNTQMVEVATGRLVGSESLKTGPDGSILSVVDSLTHRLVKRLNIQSSDRAVEASIAYTLTNSTQALRLYVEGIQELYRAQDEKAIKKFEEAVKVDSAFAMAYYQLSTARRWHGGTGADQALGMAWQHVDKVSERERLLIEARMKPDLLKRKEAFEYIVERYPNEKLAWYELCETLFHSYWIRSAVTASLQAVELDPNFLLAYIHPIDFYMGVSQHADAIPLLTSALDLDSLHLNLHFYQAYLYHYSGNIVEANKGFSKVLRLAGTNTMGLERLLVEVYKLMAERNYKKAENILGDYRQRATGYHVIFSTNGLAALAALQGKYRLAEHFINQAVELRPNSVFQTYEAGRFAFLQGKGDVVREKGVQIIEGNDSETQPITEAATLGRHLLFLSALAEDDVENAEQALSVLKTLVVGQENAYKFLYYDALGRLSSLKGDYQQAQAYFNQAMSTATLSCTDVIISFRELILDGLIECLEQSKSYQAILQHMEESLPSADQLLAPHPYYIFSASTYAVLPRIFLSKIHALESLGKNREATEGYEAFLDIWKDADDNLPESHDARVRLARLKEK